MKKRSISSLLAAGVIGICTAGAAQAAPYTIGNVFASVGNGLVKEFTPTGVLVQTLDTTTNAAETTGSAFDSAGNFYVTGFGTSTLSKFDNNGGLQSPNYIAGNNPSNNESVVFDKSNNFYVGGAGGNIIRKFDFSGSLLDTYTVAIGPRGTDWIDLAADQKTLYYTSEGGRVMRYDTSSHTQLTDFTSTLGGTSFALRLLADGGALVAHTTNVLRLDNTGAVAQTYSLLGSTTLFALNLDPDGTSFWTGNIDGTGKVFHVRISDGAVLGSFDTVSPGGRDLAGLSIFGEITQGGGNGNGNNVPEPASLALLAIGLAGLGTVRRRMQRGLGC